MNVIGKMAIAYTVLMIILAAVLVHNVFAHKVDFRVSNDFDFAY